jgi:hypothetical protein
MQFAVHGVILPAALTLREVCCPQVKDASGVVLAGPERSPSLSSIGGLTWTVEPSAWVKTASISEFPFPM